MSHLAIDGVQLIFNKIILINKNMKNVIKIYLHGENEKEPKLVEISEDSTLKELLLKYQEAFGITDIEIDNFNLFIDQDEAKNNEHHHKKVDIKKHSHVHCHRCEKVNVFIDYNGKGLTFTTKPSETGVALVKNAAKQFDISEGDAVDLILKTSSGEIIQKTDRIGSFVSYPNCEIKLHLIHDKRIQG